MPRFRLCLRGAVIFLTTCLLGIAHGGTWTIQQISATPGSSANVVVSFSGDGTTRDAQLNLNFDEARLSLPSGILAGGANGGLCGRPTTNSVVVLVAASSAALPAASTVICTIPFTVPSNAQRGFAKVAATAALCSDALGQPSPCATRGGGVQIEAPAPAPAVALPLSTRLVVRLSAAPGTPSVALITGGRFAAGYVSPLPSLNVGNVRMTTPLVPIRKRDAERYILENPSSPEAVMSRYFIVDYATQADLEVGLAALRADPSVADAQRSRVGRFLASAAPAFAPPSSPNAPVAKTLNFAVTLPQASLAGHSYNLDTNQYHRNQLSIPEAWTYAGGWGLVALADTGLAVDHPDLRAFAPVPFSTNLNYTGGNYLSALSYNQVAPQYGPDERAPEVTAFAACDALDGILDGYMRAATVGHGTHTAGLIAANASSSAFNSNALEGSCANCGIAMRKIMRLTCASGVVAVAADLNVTAAARLETNKIGAQVFNVSFGEGLADNVDEICIGTTSPDCEPIQAQLAREVLLPSAAGNARAEINFPAEHIGVPAIGGNDSFGDIWDDSPGGVTNCLDITECGTNYRISQANDIPEVLAAAKSVRSTMYPGRDWAPTLMCGDSFGGPMGDGEGLCTGTSMSAPEIAGLYGLLRSINPLVPAGNVDTGPARAGVRTLVNATASHSTAGLPRDSKAGFGIPNAALAARGMLGTVRGAVVPNRAIPLFGFYSAGAKDYAVTANAQLGTALQIDQTAAYVSLSAGSGMLEGAPVPGYSAFPGVNIPQPPRARAYVLSTEFSPLANAAVTPLYMLERKRNLPLGCINGQLNCNTEHRDFMVITRVNDLNFAVNAGYSFLGLQGYIYEACGNEPACIPPGTQKLYLQCKLVDDDCAVFLQAEKAAFEAQGYTTAFKGGSEVLGYAYGTSNSDADLLPDAVELVAGTNVNAADSDADGLRDDIEYPIAGISTSDPCSPGPGFCAVANDAIFANGLE
jgi:serine protease